MSDKDLLINAGDDDGVLFEGTRLVTEVMTPKPYSSQPLPIIVWLVTMIRMHDDAGNDDDAVLFERTRPVTETTFVTTMTTTPFWRQPIFHNDDADDDDDQQKAILVTTMTPAHC